MVYASKHDIESFQNVLVLADVSPKFVNFT